jgi:outer membrane protein TolC
MSAVEAQLSSGRLGSLLEALDAGERFYASRQRLVQAIAQQLKAHAQLLVRVGQLGDLQR